jgi:hypothetical protein
MSLLDLEIESRTSIGRFLAAARSQVEEEAWERAWERAWEEGLAMNLEQAISYALEGTEGHT